MSEPTITAERCEELKRRREKAYRNIIASAEALADAIADDRVVAPYDADLSDYMMSALSDYAAALAAEKSGVTS